MNERDLQYLINMLDTAERISKKIAGISKSKYYLDENLRLALAYLVQNIGEAASKISQETKNRFSDIPWREVTGIRNKIVHDYMGLDEDIVWDVVSLEIPALIESLKRAIDAE